MAALPIPVLGGCVDGVVVAWAKSLGTTMASARRAAASGSETELAPQAAADELTRLYRLARALCGSADLAEDLVQETYARVFARPRMLRGGDAFSYMARALRNTFYNHLRSARARPEQAAAADELERADRDSGGGGGGGGGGGRGDPHAALVSAELYRAIGALPDDQREVVALVDIAGLSYKEAARVLRVPPGTIMSRLYRGRARLAEALG